MTRSRIGVIAACCVVVLVSLSVIPAVGLLSSSARADPGCSPWYYPSYTVYIFNGLGHIHNVNLGLGFTADYYNGQVVTFKVCSRYQAQDFTAVVSDSKYAAYTWASQTGTFQYINGPSETYFYPALANGNQGALLMVITLTGNWASNWGGAILSGSGFTRASGTFILPSTVTYVPWSTTNYLVPWIGIGGKFGTNLWQAGISIAVTSSGTTLRALYEDYPAHDPTYDTTFVTPFLQLGDSITVTVSSSGGVSSTSICDNTRSKCWNPAAVTFTPDSQSAEWVSEVLGGTVPASYALPQFSLFSVGGISDSVYNGLWGPLTRVDGVGMQNGGTCQWMAPYFVHNNPANVYTQYATNNCQSNP